MSTPSLTKGQVFRAMQAPVEEEQGSWLVVWRVIRRGGVWLGLELATRVLSQSCLTLAVVIAVGDLQEQPSSGSPYLTLLISAGLCVPALDLARHLAMMRRRKLTTSSLGAGKTLPKHRYVLYLRPFFEDHKLFAIDRGTRAGNTALTLLARILEPVFVPARTVESDATWEERVIRIFCRFGKVVAVGNPSDPQPFPGAERFDLPEKDWKPPVRKAIRNARLVLIVAGISSPTGSAEGTLWEYTEAVRLLQPSRLVLLVCGDEEEYQRFRAGAAEVFAQRAKEFRHRGVRPPALPDCPELRHAEKLRRPRPLRGLIQFDEHWKAKFVRFDPTREQGATEYRRWRATLRRQIDPVMVRIEEQLPGTVVVTNSGRKHAMTGTSFFFLSIAWTVAILWPLSAGYTMWQRLALLISSVVFPLGHHRVRRLDEPSHTRPGLEVRLPSDNDRCGDGTRQETRTKRSTEWEITQQGLIGNSVLALAGFVGAMVGAHVNGVPRPLHDVRAAFVAMALWCLWTAVRIHRARGARVDCP